MRLKYLYTCIFACTALIQSQSGTAAAVGAGFRAPYLPTDDAQVLQDVPSNADPAVRRMQQLRGDFAAKALDLPTAIRLADAYIDYGRQIGDAHFAGYAEAVIAPWLGQQAPSARVLVTEATILQYRHEFSSARGLLQRALKADPQDAQAWLTLATLDMVQGDYRTAGTDCAQVVANAGVELGFACMGNLRSYLGQARQGLSMLRQAESAGTKATASYRAWIEGLIAETAERMGDWPLAESAYRAALQSLPQDNFLLVAYADFLLDRSRPAEVLGLLADHAQSDTAYLRLALAQSALRRPEAARYTWIMAARFAALAQRDSDYFGREEARFALELEHDPRTALDLALRNWQRQRAPWDARVLLQAAAAARRPEAARAALEFLDQTHLEDPMILPLAEDLRAQLQNSSGAATSDRNTVGGTRTTLDATSTAVAGVRR